MYVYQVRLSKRYNVPYIVIKPFYKTEPWNIHVTYFFIGSTNVFCIFEFWKKWYWLAPICTRGIEKIVSFFHRIIIYGWIYIIFCHYQQQSVVNRKKTLKCKVRQTCDVTMTLMTSYIGDVVVKMLEDRCGWCTLSGFKCYSTSAIIVKFSDNICT